jgi:hypothetical protein
MTDPPRVTIWTGGQLALNEPLVSTFLGDVTHVGLYAEDDTTVVVDPDESTYILQTRGYFNGQVVNAHGTLKSMNCDRPDEALSLDFDVSTAGLVQIDVSLLLSE